MNEEENKKVTRRKFLEDSSKKALGGTAAAFLGLSMIEPKTVHAEHCWFSCAGDCSGCTYSCTDACLSACTSSCTGRCANACTNDCVGGCSGIVIKTATDDAECGTPVEERTSSTLHVTV